MENIKIKEKATDMELVLFLIKHINNPCEDLHGNNIRGFYMGDKWGMGTFDNCSQ